MIVVVKVIHSFDEEYYQRYYDDPKTSVASQESVLTLADFVCSYLKHIGQPVTQVIDMGCGMGFWRKGIERHFPEASYTGVERSDYLCERMGWTRGSVLDFKTRRKAELVICQGVLQYLNDAQCRKAITNLAKLSRGALYLEALTTTDWEEVCDQDVTDGNVYLRPGSWYRGELAKYFTNCGGGLLLTDSSEGSLYELEKLD